MQRLRRAAAGAVIANGAPYAASKLAQIPNNPSLTIYPYITTLTESPAVQTIELPVKQVAGSFASFFEKLNPVSILSNAVDLTSIGFVGVGCAAFNN